MFIKVALEPQPLPVSHYCPHKSLHVSTFRTANTALLCELPLTHSLLPALRAAPAESPPSPPTDIFSACLCPLPHSHLSNLSHKSCIILLCEQPHLPHLRVSSLRAGTLGSLTLVHIFCPSTVLGTQWRCEHLVAVESCSPRKSHRTTVKWTAQWALD